ncbi:MAG: DNA cytosine methyltransferase [Verrucomicrobiota bacterium]|jgi:DNA (cytosine-5)-methyltransferase 1
MVTHTTPSKRLAAVDFFCGAGGMSYGLSCAGLSVLGGVDLDAECLQTYEGNIPGARFLKADITQLSVESLADYFGLECGDDNIVFCGCSPCQFWSKVRTDRGRSRKTAFLLKHFERFIAHFRPGFLVVENVPGLRTMKEHTILPQFLSFLGASGYAYGDGVVDAAGYGVPQHRHRYLLLATRLKKKVKLPRGRRTLGLTVRRFIGEGLSSLAAGQQDPADALHRAARLSPRNLERVQATPANGGDRSSWRSNPDLQLPAYEGRDGIFRDVYARMFWDRPAPTITTRFNSLSNGRFGHPEQHRAISLREGAVLQTFPKSFCFHGTNQASVARQIGNAVPPAMAMRIGRRLMEIAANG